MERDCLSVRVLGGKGLIPLDRGGTSDPYCVVSIGQISHKTKVKKKTLSPDWSETDSDFTYYLDGTQKDVEFEVLDWNRLQYHKRMGKAKMRIKDINRGQEYNQWLLLRPAKEGDRVSGEIHVVASYRDPIVRHFTTSSAAIHTTWNEEEPLLFTAIKNNDLEMVMKLVRSSDVNINERDKTGYTPLHQACVLFSDKDDEILTVLLRHKDINVNLENDDKNTPLHYFCQKFRSPNCTEAFELFLEKGANVNAQNNLGETPLHKAIFNNTIKILMVNMLIHKAHVEVNRTNLVGETPLHYSVRCGREDLITILLKNGADADIRGTKEKKTPYELAVEAGHEKIAVILNRCRELYDWLDDIDMEKYYLGFLKEEMYRDLLPDLDENILDRIAPNIPAGHRIKILKEAHKLRDEQQEGSLSDTETVEVVSTVHDIEQELEKLKYIKSGDWILHNSELEFAVKLGSGTSGTVYKGLYKGKDVAIKVLKSEQSNKELEEFKKEFQIMSSIQSPYLVFFFGAVLEPKMCMVMELCSRGSLYHVMNDLSIQFNWERVFNFAKEMVRGVETLHNWTPQVVHRDLKSLNLMVNELWHVKVADFGLSRFNTDTHRDTLVKMRGTYAYCAPEVYFGEQFSDKADIYSTAIILWELITRCITREYMRPYQEFPNLHYDFQIIIQTAKKGIRPTIPERCPEVFVNLVKSAWEHEPDKRPSAKELFVQIETIEQEYLAHKEAWDSLIDPPKEKLQSIEAAANDSPKDESSSD